MRYRSILAMMLMVGACSTPAPTQPSTDTWQLYDRWSGGKPPGTTLTTTLASDGRFTSTRDQDPACELVLPQDLVRPITAALGTVTLARDGGTSRRDGSVATESVLTIATTRYSLPARDAAPALHAAIDQALTEGTTRCRGSGTP